MILQHAVELNFLSSKTKQRKALKTVYYVFFFHHKFLSKFLETLSTYFLGIVNEYCLHATNNPLIIRNFVPCLTREISKLNIFFYSQRYTV